MLTFKQCKPIKSYRVVWLVLCLVLFTAIPAAAKSKGEDRVVRIKTQGGTVLNLYKGSYALLIGESHYKHWPDLAFVRSELAEVEAALKDQGFVVRTLYDPGSKELEAAFDDFIGDYGYDQENRLLFFFSGHGATRPDGSMGYLVPSDAPLIRKDPRGFMRKAISMSQVMTWCREMTAKHALFIFDSCFSGTIFESKGVEGHPPPISDYTAKPVRYFISAGGADQQVPARSSFTPSFVWGLKGEADLNRDGYITGTELGMYLHDKVLYYRNGQTPQHGKIRDPALDKGDFVFQLAGGPGVPGSDPRKERIAQLLKEANALLQRNKLTAPPGANALDKYNQVLRLDPLNVRADAGLKKIVDRYLNWARSRYETGNYDKAESFLANAEKVSENDERVWRLAEQIRKAKKKSADRETKKSQRDKSVGTGAKVERAIQVEAGEKAKKAVPVTLEALEDATIIKYYPAKTENGQYLSSGVSTWSPGHNWNGGNRHAFVKFDVSNMPESIEKAELVLRSRLGNGAHGRGSLEVYQVTSHWNETDITWKKHPQYRKSPIARVPFSNQEGWVKLDITSVYNSWKRGVPNYGLMLNTDGSETVGSCWGNGEYNCRPGTFYSKDNGNREYRPRLYLR